VAASASWRPLVYMGRLEAEWRLVTVRERSNHL